VIEYWSSSDNVQYWSSICTIVGLPIALTAFGVAARQLLLAQRVGSAAALITIHEAIRKGWIDYLKAGEDSQEYAAADLFNSLEVACAALNDGIFFGESRKLLELYILHSLKLIERDPANRDIMVSHLQDRSTFKNIRETLRKHRKLFRALGAQFES
jgi:hypothetical protein